MAVIIVTALIFPPKIIYSQDNAAPPVLVPEPPLSKLYAISENVKLIKPKDEITGKDVSGDGQITVVKEVTRRPIVFKAVSSKNKPLKGLPVSYELVYAPSGDNNAIQVVPINNAKMETDENGYFKANIIAGPKDGKYAMLFFAQDSESNIAFAEFVINAKRKNWGNWLILWLFGAMGLFLLGMKLSSDGLLAIAGARMKELIAVFTKSPIKGIGSGALMTVFTQSSSATSSMLVGFVNAGLMTLKQSISVLMGAAVGTTIIVQIISFNVSDIALPLVAIGVTILFMSKKPSSEAISKIIIGFGLIFYGMRLMQDTVAPLREFDMFANVMQYIAGASFWCLVMSAILTAFLHSSAGTLGIVISLAAQGFFTLQEAVPIILGANLGTTVTALMASVGTSINAKRVAWAHVIYKGFGVLLFIPIAGLVAISGQAITRALSEFYIPIGSNNISRQIANTHVLINVSWAIIFLPFIGLIEKMSKKLIKDPEEGSGGTKSAKYLSLNIDETPSVAIGTALREISRMGRFVEEMFRITGEVFFEKKDDISKVIETKESKVDTLRFSITEYLIKYTQKATSKEEARKIVKLLYIVSHLENVGDLIFKNLLPQARKMIAEHRTFSKEGEKELHELYQGLQEHLSRSIIALTTFDQALAKKVIDNRKPFFQMADEFHLSHLRRFRQGLHESVDTSTIHLDLINYLCRVEYYVSEIAALVCDQSPKHLDI